jgi:hypothetical protein
LTPLNDGSVGIDPIGRDAARLALLALRGCIHASMPLSHDAYALAGDRASVLTAEEMVPHLLATPKPLVSRATASRGVVVIHWKPPRPGTLEQRTHAATRALLEHTHAGESESLAVSMRELVTAAGVPYERAMVLCAARDETLLLPTAAVERWQREYVTVLGGWGLDSVQNPLAEHWPAYREARAKGAACMLRVGDIPRAAT